MENYIKVEKTGLDGEIFFKLFTGENNKLYLSKLINLSYYRMEIVPEDIEIVECRNENELFIKTKKAYISIYFKYHELTKEELEKIKYRPYIETLLVTTFDFDLELFVDNLDRSCISIVISGTDILKTLDLLSSGISYFRKHEDNIITKVSIRLPYVDPIEQPDTREFYQMLGSHIPDQYKGSDKIMDMMIEEIKKLNKSEQNQE